MYFGSKSLVPTLAMTEKGSIALGVVFLSRTERLKRLLASAERSFVDNVYIADNGPPSSAKDELYNRSYPFDLEVIDVPEPSLGRGRKAITDEVTEDYLLVVDSDVTIPNNVNVLLKQLQETDSMGGICGNLIEPEVGRFVQGAKDFREKGNKLYRGGNLEKKDVEFVAGSPLVRFDQVPNVTLFDVACLDDYTWDPEYTIGYEHVDFYVGHWKLTDWEFAVSPEVIFPHYPGGDTAYNTKRMDDTTITESRDYFLDKWGYDSIYTGKSWFDTEKKSIADKAYEKYQEKDILEFSMQGARWFWKKTELILKRQ